MGVSEGEATPQCAELVPSWRELFLELHAVAEDGSAELASQTYSQTDMLLLAAV